MDFISGVFADYFTMLLTKPLDHPDRHWRSQHRESGTYNERSVTYQSVINSLTVVEHKENPRYCCDGNTTAYSRPFLLLAFHSGCDMAVV
ncbi:hypothetical protein Aduo_019529 [Ancylostoma duodenale]